MELHEIRYFLAAARDLNFRKAARACNISQPALTRAIQKLEGELGGALLVRRPGLVELTPLGRSILPALQAIDQEVADVRRRAKLLSANAMTPLRLGVMCTVGPGRFIDAVATLRMEQPAADISIVDGHARAIVEKLVAGEVDIAISAWPTYPDGVVVELLQVEPYVLIASNDYGLAPGEPLSLDIIREHPYLQRLNCEFDDYYEAKFGTTAADVEVRFASEREDWIQSMVAAGLGLAIVPASMSVLPGITKRMLSPEVSREISILRLRDTELSPTADRFVELLRIG